MINFGSSSSNQKKKKMANKNKMAAKHEYYFNFELLVKPNNVATIVAKL
jgi:hypothetical protein